MLFKGEFLFLLSWKKKNKSEKEKDSWHFQWYLSARQMWNSNQVCCFPFLFFYSAPAVLFIWAGGPGFYCCSKYLCKMQVRGKSYRCATSSHCFRDIAIPRTEAFGLYPAVPCSAFCHFMASQHWKVFNPFSNILWLLSSCASCFKREASSFPKINKEEKCLFMWTQKKPWIS